MAWCCRRALTRSALLLMQRLSTRMHAEVVGVGVVGVGVAGERMEGLSVNEALPVGL